MKQKLKLKTKKYLKQFSKKKKKWKINSKNKKNFHIFHHLLIYLILNKEQRICFQKKHGKNNFNFLFHFSKNSKGIIFHQELMMK